jgi:hypothetical protein
MHFERCRAHASKQPDECGPLNARIEAQRMHRACHVANTSHEHA